MSDMSDINSVPNFGRGLFSISAYETGWVAVIPSPTDSTKPAFPQSLDWIRKNQLSDGSWGAEYPDSAYNKVVSTASALICLKKWYLESDRKLIESGVEAYNRLVEKLEDPVLMTIGFELIVPALVDRANSLGLDLENKMIDKLRKIRQQKLIQFKKLKKIYDKKGLTESAWLTILEGMEPIFEKQELKDLVDNRGIVGNCYSATAFALIIDPTLNQCFDAIEKEVERNGGGISAYSPLEVFAMSWSLGFLSMGGFDISEQKYKTFVDTLESYWIQRGGHLGGSLTLEADADDTSNALFALNRAGRLIDSANCEQLFQYFRGDHFVTYKYEITPSLTTNFHCLMALKRYRDNPRIKDIVDKVVKWIRSEAKTDDKYLFRDKWHFSPFYPMSRAVLALEGVDNDMALKCIQQMIDLQNKDGGWGLGDQSSSEETAFVVLTLCFWLRTGHKESVDKMWLSLTSGKEFLKTSKDRPLWPLWITKSLYCLTDTVRALVYAAKYSEPLDEPLEYLRRNTF